MGLLGKMLDKAMPGVRMKDPVRGQAEVVACSDYHGRGVKQACTMQIVVHADGVAPTAQEHHLLAPRDKWPTPGMTLPVTVDRADPTKMYVMWDEVQGSQEQERQAAEALAAKLRGERPG